MENTPSGDVVQTGVSAPGSPAPGTAPAGIRLSVVAPCRNEIENLPEFLRQVRAALEDPAHAATVGGYEVIIVDDGSTDGSRELAVSMKAEYPRLRVVALDGGHGKTSALAAGFAAARGEVVATIDADLQDDPADIPAMMRQIGEFDAVNGRRAKRQDNGLRRISSRIANWVRNKLTGETIADSAGGLKVYRTECLRRLKLFHGLHRFMPTLMRMEGFRVTEIPVNNRPRIAGRAKYGFWNRVFVATADLLAVRWMKRRMLRHKSTEL
jgi:glycosyltransferase involved in cell wall biosynthesis